MYLLQILLHDPKDKPLMLQRGFKVSPGFVTQVAVSPTYVSIIRNAIGLSLIMYDMTDNATSEYQKVR